MLSTSLLNSLTDIKVIDYIFKDNFNAALFRMPGREDVAKLFVSDRLTNELVTNEGFLIAPFSNQSLKVIPADYSRELQIAPILNIPSEDISLRPMPKDYAIRVNKIVQRLKQEGGKVVLSSAHQGVCKLDIVSIFAILSHIYPDAFVFCFKIKDEDRVWVGASPEVLIRIKDNQLYTMALAGTRRSSQNNSTWDEKNAKEQQMVTDFICDICRQNGLSPHLSQPHTRKAGNIEHICTEFEASIPEAFNLKSFLKEMAPTPAVSGLPRDKALEDIHNLEAHNRGYYAGYCGLAGSSNLSLFVTLRCMSLDLLSGNCTLFAGGGITAQSEAENEWQEVNFKVATLAKPLGITLFDSAINKNLYN